MRSPACCTRSRFAAAPLAVLAARSTGRTARGLSRSAQRWTGACRAVAARDRRDHPCGPALWRPAGHRAVGDNGTRGGGRSALDSWFDRIAGAVHAFGGEVLKFIGDGVLAIFPIGERSASAACDAALNAVKPARAWNILTRCESNRTCRPCPSAWPSISATCCGAISARPTGLTSPQSVQPSTWSAGLRVCASSGPQRPDLRGGRRDPAPLTPLGEHALRGIALPCAVFTLAEH